MTAVKWASAVWAGRICPSYTNPFWCILLWNHGWFLWSLLLSKRLHQGALSGSLLPLFSMETVKQEHHYPDSKPVYTSSNWNGSLWMDGWMDGWIDSPFFSLSLSLSLSLLNMCLCVCVCVCVCVSVCVYKFFREMEGWEEGVNCWRL